MAVVAAAGVLLSCSKDSTGPANNPVRLTVVQGADQFVVPGGTAAVPMAVQATDPSSGRTISEVEVTWRLVEGDDASAQPSTSATDDLGVASAAGRAGPDEGTYRFEATAPRMVGQVPTFVLRAVPAPIITSVSPSTIEAGQTVEIDGSGFSGSAQQHRVLFGGLRGTITSVTTTRITARAPDCLLTRSSDVRVTLGNVVSNAVGVETRAGPITPVAVPAGQRRTITNASDLACMAVEGVPAGARYLLVTQNAARAASAGLRYELTAIAGGNPPVTLRSAVPAVHHDAASDFELGLRRAERELGPVLEPGADAVAGTSVEPGVGDRRDFNVLTADGGTRRISATVQLLSQRAVVYVDDGAPAGGLTAADLTYFAALFDDPIFASESAVFGQPSDIDGNNRVIILFTPGVNQLTAESASGFIAGYFYGCDLVAASRCSATNRGEIFYSMVADPGGEFGAARSRATVRSTVPAVLAHEFQHMINFSRKDDRLDILWLSEGLAHAAEDVVGQALEDRGDATAAEDFRRPNYIRAHLYLARTGSTPLVSQESPGTLEQRGGAWLLVKYLMGHYGGTTLLNRLTGSTVLGADNIEESTGQTWSAIYSGFTTALWADAATGITGTLEPTSEFAGFSLSEMTMSIGSPFPLLPPTIGFQDFQIGNTLPPGSQSYMLLDVPSATAMLRLGLTGILGGPFESTTRPQLTILRVR